MAWHTANICLVCWNDTHTNLEPAGIANPKEEICCYCHKKNKDGIYIRDRSEVLNCSHV